MDRRNVTLVIIKRNKHLVPRLLIKYFMPVYFFAFIVVWTVQVHTLCHALIDRLSTHP